MGSSFADDASPLHQADLLVELLDHLRIDRMAAVGGSAGALSAAEFALRHSDRCSDLVLLVPAANLTNRDPVEFTRLQGMAVDVVLGSNFWFWALASLAPGQMVRTLLATDPALMKHVAADEKRRAELILDGLMPVGRKTNGLRTDAFWAGKPSPTAYEDIAVRTLILSCEDDLFGTAATARLLAERIRVPSLRSGPRAATYGWGTTQTWPRRSPASSGRQFGKATPNHRDVARCCPAYSGPLLPVRFRLEIQ
ncbi:MAG: alpha/beta hydrolase [Rhizobiaceae bacterium]